MRGNKALKLEQMMQGDIPAKGDDYMLEIKDISPTEVHILFFRRLR